MIKLISNMNYRWFILNQAFWDVLKSFEFSCNNYVARVVKPGPRCFYFANNGQGPFDYTTKQFVMNNIYAPLLLLSVTRFIALYFVNFYDKLTRGYRIIFTILFFNFFILIWDIEGLTNELSWQRGYYLHKECQIRENSNSSSLCTTNYIAKNNSDFIVKSLDTFYWIAHKIKTLKPEIYQFISIFSTSMILLKVAKQAKFQLKHNRRDFFASARIAVVIACQTGINLFIFVLQFPLSFVATFEIFSSVPVVTTKLYVEGKNYTGYFELRFPLWLDGSLGLTGPAGEQIITQSRIFIESIIVLGIMTGYREAIIKIFQKMYLMKDSSNPMFAFAVVEESRNSDDFWIVQYAHFNLSVYDTFGLFKNQLMACEMKDGITLGIILKKPNTKYQSFVAHKWNKLFINNRKINEAAFNNIFRKNVFEQHLRFANDGKFNMEEPKSCSEYPKVQAIIDKVDNMTFSDFDEWTRYFAEEFKANIKPLHAYMTKISITKNEISYYMFGDEHQDDVTRCPFINGLQKSLNNDSQKCRSCIVRHGINGFVVQYLER